MKKRTNADDVLILGLVWIVGLILVLATGQRQVHVCIMNMLVNSRTQKKISIPGIKQAAFRSAGSMLKHIGPECDPCTSLSRRAQPLTHGSEALSWKCVCFTQI